MKMNLILLSCLFIGIVNCQDVFSHSCIGRCFGRYNSTFPCQCTSNCITYENCCQDYMETCQHVYAEQCNIHLPDRAKCQTCAFTNGSYVTNKEIFDFTKKLWKLNTFRPQSSDFIINKQGFTTTKNRTDMADKKLFTYVNESILQLESFRKLIVLFDNYEKQQGINETFINNKRKKQNNFINFVLSTPVGKALRRFLFKHGLSGCGRTSHFKYVLRKIWFENFSRKRGAMDTSGFEHVFIGEQYGTKTFGFHNWLRYYFLEKEGKMNYMGHLDAAEDNFQPGRQKLQFVWEEHRKPITSFIVGVTPEWEFSVFTLCFLTRPDNNRCKVFLEDLNGKPYDVPIQSYTWRKLPRQNGLRYIGTTFVM